MSAPFEAAVAVAEDELAKICGHRISTERARKLVFDIAETLNTRPSPPPVEPEQGDGRDDEADRRETEEDTIAWLRGDEGRDIVRIDP